MQRAPDWHVMDRRWAIIRQVLSSPSGGKSRATRMPGFGGGDNEDTARNAGRRRDADVCDSGRSAGKAEDRPLDDAVGATRGARPAAAQRLPAGTEGARQQARRA